MRNLIFISILTLSFSSYSQLEFLEKKRILFVGADSIENKKIISSVYVVPMDSARVSVEINILHHWKSAEKIDLELGIDRSSVEKNVFQIVLKGDTSSAYRFYNELGYEMLIAKEKHFSYYRKGETEKQHTYNLSLSKMILPKKANHFVSSLPVMHEK